MGKGCGEGAPRRPVQDMILYVRLMRLTSLSVLNVSFTAYVIRRLLFLLFICCGVLIIWFIEQ